MHRDWSLIVGVEWRSGVGDGSQASGFTWILVETLTKPGNTRGGIRLGRSSQWGMLSWMCGWPST